MAKADNTKISPPSIKSDPASDNQEVSTQSEQLSSITSKPVNFGAVVDASPEFLAHHPAWQFPCRVPSRYAKCSRRAPRCFSRALLLRNTECLASRGARARPCPGRQSSGCNQLMKTGKVGPRWQLRSSHNTKLLLYAGESWLANLLAGYITKPKRKRKSRL